MDAITITDRINRKEAALKDVANATENVIAARTDLETATTFLINQGLEGSNERARSAELASRTEGEREVVAQAERLLRERQLELEIASLRLREIDMLLKLNASP